MFIILQFPIISSPVANVFYIFFKITPPWMHIFINIQINLNMDEYHDMLLKEFNMQQLEFSVKANNKSAPGLDNIQYVHDETNKSFEIQVNMLINIFRCAFLTV